MEIVENKEYLFYGKVYQINDSQASTLSVIVDLMEKEKVVVRVSKQSEIRKNEIYRFEGVCKPYKSRMHIYISNFVLIDELNDISEEEKNRIKNSFASSKAVDSFECIKMIEDTINSLENKVIKEITLDIYNKYKEDFTIYPAATRFHHAYKHGLINHTCSCLKLAKSYIDIYGHLNSDLIYAGIILHDVMKIKEIRLDESQYSIEGKLIGHISLISQEVAKVAYKLGYEDCEETLLLSHIVLSHHEETQFGSPKHPQIIEALIIHLCDVADAKIAPTIEALEGTKVGEFSEPIPVNNKEKFLKHSLSK